MYSASDLRKNLKIQIDGDPYVIVEFTFSKPGKGQSLYRCKLKNMINGNQFERTFRSVETFEPANLREKRCSTSTRKTTSTVSWTRKHTTKFT